MIEAKGTRIYSDEATVHGQGWSGNLRSGPHAGFVRPDYDASNKRAEHIAQALRPPAESEGVKVL